MSNSVQHLVVVYRTDGDSKWDADDIYHYLCDRDAALALWCVLTKQAGYRYVEVYGMDGALLEPEKGIGGLR